MPPLVRILVRVVATYIYLLALVRISGKRVVAKGTPFDLLVAFIAGDMPDDMIWGEIPFSQGLAAMGTIFVLHILVSYLAFRSITVDRLLGSGPASLLHMGKLERPHMNRQRVNERELDSMLRLHKVQDRAEVAEGTLEPTGLLGIVQRESHKTAQKADSDELRRVVK